ncbi:hypothetical protein IAT40_006845 [Kwoniella sp. CBS 6097]
MKSLFRPFPTPLSNRQWFYLLVLQGVGAGIIDGGANFAVAYAMYHNQKHIKMWVLAENTIAGDLGVTPIIQCLASMVITSTLVHTDLHHNAVQPLPFVWPHIEHLPDPRLIIDKVFTKLKPKPATKRTDPGSGSSTPDEKTHNGTNRSDHERKQHLDGENGVTATEGFVYYIKMLIRFIFEGTETNMLLPLNRSTPTRFLLTAAQGAGLGIVLGLPLWLLFIIVLGPIYKHDNMSAEAGGWKWAPMVIKCVYGAVLGWYTNPIIASMALGSQAEHHLLVIPEDVDVDLEGQQSRNAIAGEGEGVMGQEGGAGVETIHEEAETEGETELDLVSPPLPGSPFPDSRSLRAPSFLGTGTGTNTSTTTPSRTRPRGRSRASSTLSNRSRPPLTANCSTMPIVSAYGVPPSSPAPPSLMNLSLPRSNTRTRNDSVSSVPVPRTPRSAPLPSGEFSLLAVPTTTAAAAGAGGGGGAGSSSPRIPTLAAPVSSSSVTRPTRARGATFSTFVTDPNTNTSSKVPGTPNSGTGSWSYALGGTGGRAQRRPRALSSLSGRGVRNGVEAASSSVPVRQNVDVDVGEKDKVVVKQGTVGTPKIKVGNADITENAEDNTFGAKANGREEEESQSKAGQLPAAWDVFGKVEESEGRKSMDFARSISETRGTPKK